MRIVIGRTCMENFFTRLTGWLFISFFLSASFGFAGNAPIDLQLISGGHDGKQASAGLLLNIPSPWHVYGPTPSGEEAAGFPPTITWEGSSNLQDVKILWPAPKKTMVQDQLSYIYEGKLFVPIELTPQTLGNPLTLDLKISLLACADTCVPVEEKLSLLLQPGDKADPFYKQTLGQEEETNEALPLITLLAIALLGGFILNFMPCVLPVLSLKVMSLIKQSKKNHMDHAKAGFFITGLGILFSFLLLALLTVLLKESGEAFGWGIHFQNPHFLLFVFLVLIAFSASLWGVFEIDLPSGLGTWLITHEGKGKVKDFLSGMFATLLATPCSAPFVGTALSFALARNIADIFLVFLFLGLGFAFPYFLVAGLPSRLIRLPKPGLWMVWVQKILGIILTFTALWIGWILSFHVSLLVLGLCVVLSLLALSLFWIKHHKKPELKAWAFAMPIFLMAWGLPWILPHHHHSIPQKIVDYWRPFDPQAIPNLVKQGKIIFVDATAEWCVTCAVNKKLVLNSSEIEALLNQPNVIAMRADWTKQDPQITEFLQSHDRYGIPFNVVFGPQSPEGVVLPEILSINLVQEAFKKAGG